LASAGQATLGGRGTPFFGMLASEKSVRGQASELLHFLVDGSQQLLEDAFQFVFGCVDNLDAETSDSIVKAARRHLEG
jgi:hypothetical protein